MATRSALAPLERQAVDWAQNRYGPQPAKPTTRQSTLDEFAEPEKDAYDSARDKGKFAPPTNTDAQQTNQQPPKPDTGSMLTEAGNQEVSMSDTSQNSAVDTAVGDTKAQEALMAASKEKTGENTQQVDMYGNPIKKAWRYY